MKHIIFLFIISPLFFCFPLQPNFNGDSCGSTYFAFSNKIPAIEVQPHHDKNIFWQSESGCCHIGMSPRQRSNHPTPFYPASYVQQNYSKFENFKHSKEWHAFFTELTNVSPKDWAKSDRKDFFYKFELYQHWTYKYFLQSFPEFEERIVELDKLSRQDPSFREKLNSHYMTYKWCGLKGDKSIADYIRKQLPRARKFLQDKQIQQERKQQARACQKKIKLQEPVRELFVGKADEIDIYKQELVETPRGSTNERLLSRNQKRAAAIQEAITNNFKISIQQYQLSSKASNLLQQHNIDAGVFKECIGNTIQQQIHQEFVDVLDNGATLYSAQEISHLTDRWYGVLSNVSFIGSSINNIGHFMLAHEIADICEGLYQIEKRKISSCFDCSEADCGYVEELWNSALTCVGNALEKGGDNVVRFTEGIQDKAIGRPARFLTEWACLFKNNPKEVFETAGSILLESVQYAFDSAQIVESLATDPLFERTFELVSDFGRTYVEPVGKKVTKAALIFWQMPAEEKAQEVVALGLQVFAVVGAAKLIVALPAQAALLKTAALLKLDQLSQMSGPVMQTGISPDGTVNIALQAVEKMSEELVAVAEEAIAIAAGVEAEIAIPAVVDVVCTSALVVRDGGSSTTGGAGTRSVKKVKLIPPEELRQRYKRLKPKSPKVEGEFDRNKLEGVGYPKRLKFTKRVAKHVFEGEAKVAKTISGKKEVDISGFHSDYKEQTSRSASVKIKTNARHPQTGAIEGGIIVNGSEQVEKTMFSHRLTPEEVWDMTIDSVGNVKDIIPQGRRFIYQTVAKDGTKIMIVSEANGEVVTFFPEAFTENFGKR